MKNRVLKVTGIFNQKQIILFDLDGIWARFGCSEEAIARGYDVQHFSDEMALRHFHECSSEAVSEVQRILIIDDGRLYLPIDIAQKYYVLRLSFELVFPMLSGEALRSMTGLDYDHLAYCANQTMLPTLDEIGTRTFCLESLNHGEYATSYGNMLLNEAVSNASQADSHRDWDTVAQQFGKAAMIHHSGEILPEWAEKRSVIERDFLKWLEKKYSMLSGSIDRKRPILLSKVADFIRRSAEKVALVVMDGMSIENFYTIQRCLASSGLSFYPQSTFSFFPTVTSVARQSIFSGQFPQEHEKPFSLDNEEKQWKSFWKSAGKTDDEIVFCKGFPDDIPHRATAVGIIINIVDDLLHAELLGLAGMQQGLCEWMRNGRLEAMLKKLCECGFTVFMTSDHGNTAAVAQGRFLKSGILSEPASRRAVIYKAPFDARELDQFSVLRYAGTYLPDGFNTYLFEPDCCYGDKGKEYITHGGMTIEEAIVPFVRIGEING